MVNTIPDAEELVARSHVLHIPLSVPFRGLHYRETLIFDGPGGPGEWAAFVEYDDEEAAWWLAAGLEQAFVGQPVSSGVPHTIPVNAIVPGLPFTEVEAWLAKFPGVNAVKVKVGEPGQSPQDDLDRVAEVRRVVGSDVTVRLDVNGAWSVEDTLAMVGALGSFTIDYVEQPVASIEDMVALKPQLNASGVRLAADELVRKTHSVDRLLGGDVCDVVIVKPSPLGGVRRSLALADQVLEAGLDVVVSSGLETSVGLSAAAVVAVHINARTGLDTAHGLATAPLLQCDPVSKPLLPQEGRISVEPVELDRAMMKGCFASAERTQWWHERLSRCLPLAVELLG